MQPPFYDARLFTPPVTLQLQTQQVRETLIKTSLKYQKLSGILFTLLRTRKALQKELTSLETLLFEQSSRIQVLSSHIPASVRNLNKLKPKGVSSTKASALLNAMPEEERKALINSILKNTQLEI